MTNAQKLEKQGMYEVLVKILGKFESCIVDTLSEAVHACPEHQDCKKCLGEWLAEEVDHDTRTEVQMQTDL